MGWRMLLNKKAWSVIHWAFIWLVALFLLLASWVQPTMAQAPDQNLWFTPWLNTETRYITSAELLLEQYPETGTEIPNSVYNGELITYTLRLENLTATDLVDIEVIDLLPSDALEQSSITCTPACQRVDESETVPEPSGGTLVISTTRQLIWELASLKPSGVYTVSFTGRVVGQPEGSLLTNRVFARYVSGGETQAVSGEDVTVKTLMRVSSAGEASISSVPTWFSEDAGGTIAQDWGDFDLDGDLDLALGSSLGTSIYRNDDGALTLIWRSPAREDGASRLSYGVRWADVTPDLQHRPELIVVGDSEAQSATDEGLNYIYAYDPVEEDFVEVATFASHLQLVRLVTGDFDGDGDVDLVGSTNAINGRVETPFQDLCPVNLYRNDGQGGFTGTVGLTETHAVRCLSEHATAALGEADFDADGDLDLALGQFPSTLKVLENVRDGQVLTETDILVGEVVLETALEYLPYDLAWADRDHDGVPELAAAYPIQRQARVYDQIGGNFSVSGIIRTTRFMTPLAVDWGDFNGDGRVDLVVADLTPRFYECEGAGQFSCLTGLDVTSSSSGGQIWSLRGIELGERQNLDLSVSNRDGPSQLYTVSTPKLATSLTEVSDKHASSVAWGDVDGNGDQDFLLGSAPLTEQGFGSYLYLNKNGTFSDLNEREFSSSSFGPHAVAFGDVDLDGQLEIAIGTPSEIQIYQDDVYNRASQQIAVPYAVRSLAWGDADDDGRLDLLVGFADGPARLYLNAGTQLQGAAVFSTTQQGEVSDLAWGDLDGDHYLDFVIGFKDQPLVAYRNNGDRTFSVAWSTPMTLPIRALALGDYDVDGDVDLAVGNGAGARDQLWENEGGTFGTAPVWTTGAVTSTTTALAWGDWENDGLLDLAMGRDGATDVVYANLGSQPGVPQFAALWSSAALSDTTGVAWGDPDGDGDLDLGVSHRDAPSGYYANTLINPNAAPLADNPPYVTVARPGSTTDAFFYSSPEILGGPETPTVTVPYVVHDAESDPISGMEFAYSLSGGTNWQPATPATTSPAPITQTTPGGVAGVFVWDAAADDAVSDHARFRVRVASQKRSGTLQDVDGSGVSPPFRVRGLDCYWPAGAGIVAGSLTPTLGEDVAFEGRVAFANGPVTYHWDFGDGEVTTGWKVQHAYQADGAYTVTLQVFGNACPIARPAFAKQTIEVKGSRVYLPLVQKRYTDTTTITTTRSLAAAPVPHLPLSNAERSAASDVALLTAPIPGSAGTATRPQADLQVHTQDLQQLTNYALGINNQPAMSGDGTRVAFWSTGRLTGQNPDGNIEIFLAEVDGDNGIDYTQITSSTGTILGGFNLYPTLDQTGDRMVFFSDRDLIGDNGDRNFEVFVAEIQADGSPVLTQITRTEDGVNILPDISSDGHFVTFISDNDLLGNGQLMSGRLEVFRADITDIQNVTFTQITDGPGEVVFSDAPAISGDGEIIAFVSDQDLEPGRNGDGNREIFLARVAPADGAITYTQVTETEAGLNEQPAISDDGTRLVYLSSNDVAGEARRLYRADLDPVTLTLNDVQQVAATGGDLDRPTLSGDGTRVAYYTAQDDDIYLFDFVDDEEKERTQLVSTYPSLSDGGTQMAFASDGRIYVKSYPLADLSLRKTSVVTQVATGDRLTYTLTLTNSGPSAGTDVVLIDDLPEGVTSLLPQSAEHTTTYPPAVITDTNRRLFELPDDGGGVDAWTSMDDNQSLLHFDSFASFFNPDDGRLYLRTFDTSGRDNHFECPLGACPHQTAEGKLGNAVYFDSGNYLHSEDPIDLQNRSFSISFWAKRDVANRGDWIAGQGTIEINRGLHLGFRADNRFTCAFFGDDLNTRPYEDTEWHHWACTYDAATRERTIYRDGVAVAQDVANAHYAGSGNFFVGSLPWAPEYFRGIVDEFAIYQRVLSPEAVHFQHAQQAPEEAAVFDSQVFTETLGLGLWGALQWLPGRISGEPLPDNQGKDAYPTGVTGAVTMTDNLMLLHLDEPDGTTSFLDASGSANDASCDGNTCPQAILGLFNGALHFDGVDDTVDLPDYFPDAKDFTFVAWVYWNGGDLGQHIFNLGRDQGNRFYLSPQGTNGNLRFVARRDGVEDVVEGPSLPVGAWVHLAVTVAGDEGTIWLNGDRLSAGPMTPDPQDVLGELTWLGRKPAGAPYFHGRLDEVAVFARALSADEIRNHYLRGATQVALQVRTCDDPACDAEPFVGMDESRVNALTATDDASSERPSFALDLMPNPYLQYRVFMSSYTLTSPSLISVTVHPQVTCSGVQTVTCQVGTEAAPLPPDRTLSFQLPAEVGTGAYFGAGETATGVPVITNTARLENRESDHEPADNQAVVTTTLESIPVQAVTIRGPQYAATDVDTVLTATVSPENASPSITYTWQSDLGTMGPYARAQSTITETFKWGQPGTRVVTVTADNNLGTLVSDTAEITVVVPISNARMKVDPRTVWGTATTLTATSDAGTQVTYDWDFGDGEGATEAPSPPTENVQTHVYQDIGVYTATVHIHNPVSAFTETDTLTVTDVPIQKLVADQDGPTELSHATTLTASLTSGTGVTLLWNFGDGVTTTIGSPDGPASVNVSHTYPQTGTYTVVVTGTNFANPPETATTSVTVEDEPLSGLTLTSDAPGRHQRPVVLTTTLAAGTNVRYTWDFGDGSPLTTTTYPTLTVPPSVERTHVYTTYEPQTVYTASVRATNSAGVLTATLPVTIVRTCWAGIEGQSGDYHVVQDAIDAASVDDLIKIAGTCDTVTQRTGRSQVGYLSKTLTLRGGYPYTLGVANPISYPTTLDAQEQGRVLYVGSGVTVTVEDLRLTGGRTTGSGGEGGGVYVAGSTLTLTHVTITDCTTAHFGGALHAQNSTLTILDSTVISNSTGNSGGGLALWTNNIARIDGTTFQENAVTGAGGNEGGGGLFLRNSGHVTLTHSAFLSNTSNWDGGGLYAYDPGSDNDLNLALDDNRFQGNEANWGAAALIRSVHDFDATNTHILDNLGLQTGGSPDYAHSVFWLRDLTGAATLTNTLIANNHIQDANGYAPGVEVDDTTATFLHTTVANNTGGDGVGVRGENATVELINSIIANQSIGVEEVSGAVSLNGVLWWNNMSDVLGGVSILNSYPGDPAFVDPAGGDYHIGSTSEAIDRGVDADVPFDIDGEVRPAGAAPDLGADEYRTCLVQLNGQRYDTVQAAVDASGDVHDVVQIAGTCEGVETYGGTDQVAYLEKTLTLRGGYSADFTAWDPVQYPTTLDAQGAGRVVLITGDITPTVEGLRITGGQANIGAGIYVINATPTLSRNVVIENQATDNGGGVLVYGEGAVLIGNRVISNTAVNNGGGLHVLNVSHLVAASNIFVDNVAGANGDGLYFQNAPAELYHTTVVDNDDTGVYVESGTVRLTNTIIASQTTGFYADTGVTIDVDGVLWFDIGAKTGGAGTINVTGALTGDPAFVDPAGGDYHIGLTSPAVDAGVPITPAWPDIDDEPHSAYAPDLGADETSALQLTKRGPDVADIAAPITYTLTVTNTGISAGDLLITDTLPANATYLRASDGGTLSNGTTISWTQAAALATDGVLTRTFTVTATETITNADYRVTSGSGAVAVGADAVTTTILPPDLQITKTGPATATVNVPFTYTLTVTNDGSKLTQIVVTDTLPTGTTFVAASDGGTLNGDIVVWDNLPNLNYGDSLSVTLTVTAVETVTNDDYSASGKDRGQTVSKAGADAVTTVIAPELAITKSGPSSANPEEAIQYTLTVTNTGGLATGVVITDRVPANATYTGGGDAFNGSTVSWNVGDVAYAAVEPRTFTVTATQTLTNADYAVSADNSATVLGTGGVTTTIAPTLSITKTAPSSVVAGSEITFTLMVTNTGGLATGVVITDRVPLNAAFIRADEGISPAAGVLTWTLSTPLSYTRSVSRTFVVTATQTITNAHYGVMADGGYRVPAPMPVIVRID